MGERQYALWSIASDFASKLGYASVVQQRINGHDPQYVGGRQFQPDESCLVEQFLVRYGTVISGPNWPIDYVRILPQHAYRISRFLLLLRKELD